jgi:NADP-dependent 3-hydroxy acid dehydrogenase YdfG
MSDLTGRVVAIARTIVHALAQPPDVSFSEILVRPTASAM